MRALLFLLSMLLSCPAQAAFYIQDGSVTQQKMAANALAPDNIQNCIVTSSVSASAITFTLQSSVGATPTAAGPCKVAFRSSTAANAQYASIVASSAVSLTVTSGSTLGCTSAAQCILLVYAVNNSGTLVLGVINGFKDEGTLASTTAEGGSGGADSLGVLYTSSTLSSKAVRYLARFKATEATAGTWATNAAEMADNPADTGQLRAGAVGWRQEWATINTGGTITSQSGNWISGVSNIGTGQATATIKTGIFSSTPSCSVTILTGSTNAVNTGAYSAGLSTTALTVTRYFNGGTEDGAVMVSCAGPS